MSLEPNIRWMIRRDVPQVLEMESHEIDQWEEREIHRELRQRNCIGFVAEVGEKIAGHMIYRLHKDKITILRFLVAHDWRGKGIGTAMLEKLESKLTPQRRNALEMELDRDCFNTDWLRRFGFKAVGLDRDLDTWLMRMEYSPASKTTSE